MKEIWKNIKDFEGYYQVSNKGRIRSVERVEELGEAAIMKSRLRREKIMTPADKGNGYLFVRLCNNGSQKNYYVHRLVAEAFLPNPLNHPQINHKDENRKNNNVDNLEWCTCEYNLNYGTHNAKISRKVAQLTMEGDLVAMFNSTREAEKITGVNSGSISRCCNGKYEHSHGYKWKFL